MKKFLFATSSAWSPLFIRVMLGLVFFTHGSQKLMGWFGGYGFDASMNYFTVTRGLPWIVGFTIIIIEFFGALALMAGIATRIWSLAFVFLNIGIILTAHANYFFMNWYGSQQGEGYEYFLLAIGMALSLVFSGGGQYSIDRLLGARPAKTTTVSTTIAFE